MPDFITFVLGGFMVLLVVLAWIDLYHMEE
jgi:hypothetical protein